MPYADPAKDRARREVRRMEIRRIVDEAKSKPCADCKVQYPLPAMQFDHIAERGVKRWNISAATAKAPSVETLLDEIAKCDVVCANCHSMREHSRDKGQFNRIDSPHWRLSQAGA